MAQMENFIAKQNQYKMKGKAEGIPNQPNQETQYNIALHF